MQKFKNPFIAFISRSYFSTKKIFDEKNFRHGVFDEKIGVAASIRFASEKMPEKIDCCLFADLVVVVVFVTDITGFAGDWADCVIAFHFAPVGSI